MTTATLEKVAETEIRARLDDRAPATRAKDVDRIMACYAPDARSFDCHSHFQFKDAPASAAARSMAPG